MSIEENKGSEAVSGLKVAETLGASPVAKPAPAARYYSHVLYFANQKPFDNPDLRWPSFIGEFVKPLVQEVPGALYWFTYYGNLARFRIFTADYEGLRPKLETLRDKLGLVDKEEEKDLTLEGDLGVGRFWEPNSGVTKSARAQSVLRLLKAGADLMVESVQKRTDGYWEFEANGDEQQNPVSAHRFSVIHLLHNMMDSKARVFAYHDAAGRAGVLSHYYYLNNLNQGRISVVSSQHHDILM